MVEAKLLWSEKKGVFRIIKKQLGDGFIRLSKKALVNVNNLENASISYNDKLVDMLALLAGALSAFACALVGGAYALLLATAVPVVVFLVIKVVFSRRIMFPLICARWNCSQPFDLLNAKPAKAYKVNEKVQVQKRIIVFQKKWKFLTLKKKMAWKTVKTFHRDVGQLEFVEMKLTVPEGIEVVTPENYQHMHKNVALETMMRPDKGGDIPWLFCAVFAMVGFMVAVALFPHGLEAAMQGLQQAASGMVPGAAAPA